VPAADLLEADVARTDIDVADLAAVAVVLVAADLCLLFEREACEVLLRGRAERLGLFRCVDAGDPDAVLLLDCVQDRDRIAVLDADDAAVEVAGVDGRCGKCRSENGPQEEAVTL
jgi:tRNA(Ser,Leu) C12 N-acetylase TAN1